MKRLALVVVILIMIGGLLPFPIPPTAHDLGEPPFSRWLWGGCFGVALLYLLLLLDGRTAAVSAGPPMRRGGLKDHEAATYLASHGGSIFLHSVKDRERDIRLARLSRVLLIGWYFVQYGDQSIRRQWCFFTPAYLATYRGEDFFSIEHLVLQGGANDLLLAGARQLARWEIKRLCIPEEGIPLSAPFTIVASGA